MMRLDPIKEAKAVQALRAGIPSLGEDSALLHDTVEGETKLFEVIDALLTRMEDDRALVEGIDLVVKDLGERKARFAKRIETMRALIEQALLIADLSEPIERPVATIYLSKRAPKLVVSDEAAIPTDFWKSGDPVLDKKALTAALKARADALAAVPTEGEARAAALAAIPRDIPGASLSNGAPSLTIRK